MLILEKLRGSLHLVGLGRTVRRHPCQLLRPPRFRQPLRITFALPPSRSSEYLFIIPRRRFIIVFLVIGLLLDLFVVRISGVG